VQQNEYELPPGPDDKIWSRYRVALNQLLWGPGFTHPGGADYILNLARQLGPFGKGMKLLDLHAGLGGGLAAIVKKYGVDADGLEPSAPLSQVAQALIAEQKIKPAPTIKSYDPEKLELEDYTYHAILAREILYLVKDKKNFLTKISQSLHERGQLILTDFLKPRAGATSPQLQSWADTDGKAQAWDVEELVHYLKNDLNMEIRAIDDISDKYAKYISRGWKAYLARAVEKVPPKDWLPSIMSEVNLCVRRVEVLQSGDLRLIQIYARKKSALDS
jgi:ubiquinone/menaquinone biosynthesis C-methylase UbiE